MHADIRGQRVRGLAEVVAVAAVYILVSTTAVGAGDVAFLFPVDWSPDETATGSGFLIGALVQVALVVVGACLQRLPELRQAMAASLAPATRKAWIIAAIATAIHIGTALLLVLPEPQRLVELSRLNLILSVVPAVDGWTQEVMFRGYVLFRLARAAIPDLAAVLVSGGLFAAIHLGYAGESGWDFLFPLVGTFMLGCFYACAVQSARGSLKPVVICHVLIIIVLQPWLALAQ